MEVNTVLWICQITMSALCIITALSLWITFTEIKAVKEAIATIVAANPELAKKVLAMIKPLKLEDDKE